MMGVLKITTTTILIRRTEIININININNMFDGYQEQVTTFTTVANCATDGFEIEFEFESEESGGGRSISFFLGRRILLILILRTKRTILINI